MINKTKTKRKRKYKRIKIFIQLNMTRETVPSLISDMGKKTVSVLAH